MKPKIFTLFTVLTLSAGALFASDTAVGGIYYKFDDVNLTATVTYRGSYFYEYDEYTGDVVIPATVTYGGNTYSVTSIEVEAFAGCSGLTSITIPNSVTSIGSHAFYGCSGLTSVTIPNSVTSIGYKAFSGCSGLTSVVWNAKNCANFSYSSYSPDAPFYDIASQITSFTFGSEVEHIPAYLCYGMENLTSVTIPNSVTSIGGDAFAGCSGLTSVTIPNSVTSIGEYAFYNVPNIVYSGTATGSPWGARSVNGYVEGYLVYESEAKTQLLACSSAATGEIIIPNSVTSIGESAFDGCSGLTAVTIPNSVTSIGMYAFSRCSGLTSVTIPNSVTSIGMYAFSRCSGLTSVTIPNSVTSIGDGTFENCSGLTSLTIPNSIMSIGKDAFSSVPNIVYSGTATGSPWGARSVNGYVEGYLVYESEAKTQLLACSSAATGEIIIPNSVTSIGDYAFRGCSGLTSVTIGNSVMSIGWAAFSGCSGLTAVVWNAKNFADFSGSEDAPFYDIASQITSFTFGSEVEHIPAYLCYGMANLTSVTIPNSVTSIGGRAFYGCSGLTSVTIGNSVMSIGWAAFSGCSGLTAVVWNAKNCADFSSSEEAPFYNIASQITSFTFGSEVEHIPARLCDDMENLTSVTIPNSATSIGDWAFCGCSGLTSITIPNSVTSIGYGAFAKCSGVTKFIIEGTPTFDEDEEYHTLMNFPKLDSIAVPAECFDIPEMYWVSCPKQVRYIKIMGGELSSDAFSVIQRNYKVLNTLDLTSATNTTLTDEAFKGCYALESLSLPSELQTIGYMALADCKNLQSIHVPSSVTDIDDSAFENCRSVTSITFGDALQSAPQLRSTGSTSNSQLRRIGNWGFYNCHNLQNLTIPEGVEEIGTAAFYGCTYLEELSLPSSVQSIGDNCFALASKLAKITVNAVTPPSIKAKTFAEVDRTIPVVVPMGSLSQYKADLYWSEFINISESPASSIDDVPTIGEFYVEPGRIVCEGEFRIYNLLGRDVTRLNGSLQGVYVVKTANAAQKVVVK